MIAWKPQFKDTRVASVRYRCLNPLAELQRREFPVELFEEENVSSYSAVIFSKCYEEKSYRIALELKKKRKSIVLDICDNHFYNPYGLEKYKIAKAQLLRMLSIADLVVASTPTLAQAIQNEARLSSVPVVVGDAIEEHEVGFKKTWLQRLAHKLPAKVLPDSTKANILWYGAHGVENAPCGMLDLLNIRETLSELCRDHPLRLVVMSNSHEKFRKYIQPLPFETIYYEWDHILFGQILRHATINVIPISRNPFTLCKSNNRLALALYKGVPTIADEIPSYTEFAPFCVLNDWEHGLRIYLSDKAVGQEHVKRARAYIQERFMIKQIGDQWMAQLSRFLD